MKKKFLSLIAVFFAISSIWAQNNNVIVYTASAKLPETTDEDTPGLGIYSFGVDMVSHTFSNGTGVIVFEDDVTTIGYQAFYSCDKLTSINIPLSVRTIGMQAFYNCSSLSSITIPRYVESIVGNAFERCTGIKTVVWNAGYCNGINFGPQVTSFTFGDEVQTIPENICKDMVNITSISIPNTASEIGNYAFHGCSKLNTIHIGDGLYKIGMWAFYKCTLLTTISLPNKLNYIGDYAFAYCSGLSSISIPEDVKTIGSDIFYACSGITSITWNAKNCSYSGEFEKFNICNQIQSVQFGDHVNVIPFGLCNEMRNLDTITLPQSLKTIQSGAFCLTSLRSVVIPDSVINIGDGAFSRCSKLSRVKMGKAVTSVSCTAFEDCPSLPVEYNIRYADNFLVRAENNLSTYTIKNGTKWIGKNAFLSSNSKLSSINIPGSVVSIGQNAFCGCDKLATIYCEGMIPPTCGSDCFYNVKKTIPICVPANNISDYQQAYGWKDFTNYNKIIAKEVFLPNLEAVVEADKNSAAIKWPKTDGSDSYELIILAEQDTVFTLTFNNQGQLLSVAYSVPERGSNIALSKDNLVSGFKYTLMGLLTNTEYTYIINAKSGEKILQKHTGSFTTTDPTRLNESIIEADYQSVKVIRNNQLHILRDNKTYTAQGAEVR